MDNLTHLLAGALLGAALTPDQPDRAIPARTRVVLAPSGSGSPPPSGGRPCLARIALSCVVWIAVVTPVAVLMMFAATSRPSLPSWKTCTSPHCTGMA